MSYTNINGRLVPEEDAKVLMQQAADSYGIGLLETILFEGGEIKLKGYHWERLLAGMELLDIPKLAVGLLEEEIFKTIASNGKKFTCRIRLKVFGDSSFEQAFYSIECFALDPSITMYNTRGLVVGVMRIIGKTCERTSALKTTNREVYNQAEQLAIDNHWNDALVLNDDGGIIESTIANIFWVKDKVIYTPPLSEGCVAGVMRRHLLMELSSLPIRLEEKELTESALDEADEVFLTNAVRRIKWVETIGARTYSNQLSSKISSLLFP